MLQKIMFNKKPDILLTKMLDKAAMHQRVIASNVANVGTPGYQRLGVSFEEKLAKAVRQGKKMRTSHPRHMPSSSWQRKLKPEVVKIENGYSNGINNVNIDEEMVDLAKNQLDFNIGTRLLSMRYSQLKTAVRGRR